MYDLRTISRDFILWFYYSFHLLCLFFLRFLRFWSCHCGSGTLLCIHSVWLKYEENLSSHRYVVAKDRSTLMAFSDNCGYSLIQHANSTSGGSLRVNCNVKSKNIAVNFLFSVMWNPSVHHLWMVFFAQAWLCNSTCHLENTGLQSYTHLSNSDTIQYM